MPKGVPQSLRTWFMIHFIVDVLFAIPLFVAPVGVLGLFGFTTVEPVTARLVGAALIGIGGASFFSYNKKKESYDILLTLKILWSVAAIIALAWSLLEGAAEGVWIILAIFAVFSGVWMYYKRQL